MTDQPEPTVTITVRMLETALRDWLSDVDYDKHKAMECDEETEEDRYPDEADGVFEHLQRLAAAEAQQPACGHCGHPATWHDPWEGCVGPDGIGSAGSGDCTCTRSPDEAQQDPADVSVASGGTCCASIHGVVGPIGPCILRHQHDGPVHKAADGTTWNLQQPEEALVDAELERLRAEVARLREGEEPITDERVIPTPAQWIWRWNRATVTERLDRVAAIQKADVALDRIHRLAADMLTWSRRTP